MYRAFVQNVLTYGTETWTMKAENLHSLEKIYMMVRWMCGVSLRDRKQSEDMYVQSILGYSRSI